jgi:hypothetical protein
MAGGRDRRSQLQEREMMGLKNQGDPQGRPDLCWFSSPSRRPEAWQGPCLFQVRR